MTHAIVAFYSEMAASGMKPLSLFSAQFTDRSKACWLVTRQHTLGARIDATVRSHLGSPLLFSANSRAVFFAVLRLNRIGSSHAAGLTRRVVLV